MATEWLNVSSSDDDSISVISQDIPTSEEPLKPKDPKEKEKVENQVRAAVQRIKNSCDEPVKVVGTLWDLRCLFFSQPNYRREIGDVLEECGYGKCNYKMLQALQKDDFFPTGLRVLTNPNLWRTSRHVLDIMWNYTNYSERFSFDLADNKVLIMICSYLSNNGPKELLKCRNKEHIAMVGISIMRNIAGYPKLIQYFYDIDVFSCIKRYSNMEKDIIKVITSTTMALVAKPNQAKELSCTESITKIVEWMNQAVGRDDLNRIRQRYTAAELGSYLLKMTVDGNIEALLKTPIIEVYRKMLQSPILLEKRQASKCLWNLSFNEHGRKAISNNENLVQIMREKSNLKEDEELTKNIEGTLEQLLPPNKPPPPTTTKTRHIFINYNEENKDIVKKIVDRIKAEGFKIWIDWEKYQGDLVTAIQQAIPSSSVVVLCISEPLKLDPSCRRVANLAHKLKKHFLPLCMQSRYDASGSWLELFLDRQYIDFSGDVEDFEKSIQEFISVLRNEFCVTSEVVDAVVNRDCQDDLDDSYDAQSPLETVFPIQTRPPPLELEKMTNKKVKTWLISSDLSSCVPKMENIDGKKLWELKCMKVAKYDLYCQELKDTYELTESELLHFSTVLEALVEESKY